jgi:hypothetical protein
MKKSIIVKFNDGTESTYIAYPPDYTKWELHTKKSISNFEGMHDILWVAHSAMKREAAGKPVKPFEAWIESIVDVDVEKDIPKVMSEEA